MSIFVGEVGSGIQFHAGSPSPDECSTLNFGPELTCLSSDRSSCNSNIPPNRLVARRIKRIPATLPSYRLYWCPYRCWAGTVHRVPVCCWHPLCRAKQGVAKFCSKLSPHLFG